MGKKTIILNPEDFKYPTKKELSIVGNEFPKLTHFGFEYIDPFQSIQSKTFENVKIKDDLFWWDNVLCNKLGKLSTSYCNVAVNYYRNVEKYGFEVIPEKSINKLLFDYYIESLYYYLFSSRDVIFQIVNVFYNLGVDEKDYQLNNKVKNSISDVKLKRLFIELANSLKDAKNIRDSFTHRFPLNKKDYRMNYIKTPDANTLEAGIENKKTDQFIYENISTSIRGLENFIISLKGFLLT